MPRCVICRAPWRYRGGMGRRTQLKAWDKRLLERIRRGRWSANELEWVLSHLDPRTPTLVIQEIHDKLIALRSEQHAN
jgi:hypothetical protein